MSNSLQPYGLQDARFLCPPLSPRVSSNLLPLCECCYLPFHPLLPPSSFAFSLSQYWGPKYWSFSFSISPSNEYSGLISFRIDWFVLLAVQGTLKSLLRHHKAAILQCSAFLMVQLLHPYMATGKTVALTIQQSDVSAL